MKCVDPEVSADGLTAASRQLETNYLVPAVVFASSVYWPDSTERRRAFDRLRGEISARLSGHGIRLGEWHLIDSEEALAGLEADGDCAAFVPLSGGIQPWMRAAGEVFPHVLLVNAYLEDVSDLGAELLHRNAHPSAVDFFANRRLARKSTVWVDSVGVLAAACRAWCACRRLRAARFLKIGETEPWVINSTRLPARFAERLGCTVIPMERDDLYRALENVGPDDVEEMVDDWLAGAGGLEGIAGEDVRKACRVTAAMKRLLDQHRADGLSMACFAMIGEINTTSCLAMSALNDSASAIGACEGDLDAAVTLFLLKALGCDFVWIANPIIRPGGIVDLVHCTAPRCGGRFAFRLLRHHESGRGVSPEVRLPGNETATLARIGAGLTAMAVHVGQTDHPPKLPACHTQIRIHLPSSEDVLDSLLGTHFVLTFGDRSQDLRLCAKFLNLEINLPAFREAFESRPPYSQIP